MMSQLSDEMGANGKRAKFTDRQMDQPQAANPNTEGDKDLLLEG